MSLQIITRAEWEARPPKTTPIRTTAREIYLHHSVGSGSRDWDSDGDLGDDYMREMQRFHQDTRGWSDIAYNHAIDPDGLEVYEGRGWGIRPGAQASHNSGTWALVVMGDFRRLRPSAALLEAIAGVIRYGIEIGKLPAGVALRGHKDAPGSATTCPGTHLYSALPEINRLIQEDELTPEQEEALKALVIVNKELKDMGSSLSAITAAAKLIKAMREIDDVFEAQDF